MILSIPASDLRPWDVLKIGGTAPESISQTAQMKPLGNVSVITNAGNTYEFSADQKVRVERIVCAS